jgi:hypothetical protein
MSCRKAFDIDLPRFLSDARADEFAAFRDHYPRCAECAAEVRAWTELHIRLEAGHAGHPEPLLLQRYEEEPERLGDAERARVAAHLRSCAACRDELAALRSFDPAGLATPAAAPAPGRAGLRELLGSLRRVLWHPAFAYAVVLLAIVPTLYRVAGPGGAPLPREPATEGEASAVRSLLGKSPAGGFERVAESEEAQPNVSPAKPDARLLEREARKSETKPQAPAERPPEVELDDYRREPAPTARDEIGDRADEAVEGAAVAGAGAELRAFASAERGAPGPLRRYEDAGRMASAKRAADPAASQLAAGLSTRREGDFIVLVVPAAPGQDVEVRVIAPDRSRELVHRFHAPGQSVDVRIPVSWVGPGIHRIVRRMGGVEETFTFAFQAPRSG